MQGSLLPFLLFGLTVRRALPWPANKVFLQIVRQSGCVNLMHSHASLQSSHSYKLNTVAWVLELTYLHVIVKCESLLGGHGKARCTVMPYELKNMILRKTLLYIIVVSKKTELLHLVVICVFYSILTIAFFTCSTLS